MKELLEFDVTLSVEKYKALISELNSFPGLQKKILLPCKLNKGGVQ